MVHLDEIVQIRRILRVIHNIASNQSSGADPAVSAASTPLPRDDREALMDAMLTELLGSVRELRCGSMAGLMQQDMSMAQLHVLWLLEHHGAMSMSQLAEQLGVSLSNATGLMDRMVERSLIERVRVPDDRRRVFVRPAAAGRLALEQTEVIKRDRMRTVLRRLDDRQLRRAAVAFRDFRQALAAESGSAADHHHYFVDDSA
jgi:DNA-binding MarR family transcriptional regulator